MPGEVPADALPCETASLAPAIQPLEHEMVPLTLNEGKGTAVVGPPNLGEVASPLLCDRRPEVGELACAACLSEPLLELHHGTSPSLFRGLALQACLPTPAPPPVVGDAEEVDRGPPPTTPQDLPGQAFAKGHTGGLLGVESP